MLLGRKLIADGDKRRYVIDYDSWLDLTEALDTVTITPDDGQAVVSGTSVAGDGKSVSFFVTLTLTGDLTEFAVAVEAITTTTQEKNDHIDFTVVDA